MTCIATCSFAYAKTFPVGVYRHAQFPMISGKSTYYTHYHITVEALVRTKVLWQAQGATSGTCVTTNCLQSYSTCDCTECRVNAESGRVNLLTFLHAT